MQDVINGPASRGENGHSNGNESLAARLKAATELLENLAGDRALLASLPRE